MSKIVRVKKVLSRAKREKEKEEDSQSRVISSIFSMTDTGRNKI